MKPFEAAAQVLLDLSAANVVQLSNDIAIHGIHPHVIYEYGNVQPVRIYDYRPAIIEAARHLAPAGRDYHDFETVVNQPARVVAVLRSGPDATAVLTVDLHNTSAEPKGFVVARLGEQIHIGDRTGAHAHRTYLYDERWPDRMGYNLLLAWSHADDPLDVEAPVDELRPGFRSRFMQAMGYHEIDLTEPRPFRPRPYVP